MRRSPISTRIRGRRLVLVIAAFLLIFPSVNAQTFEWAELAGGPSEGPAETDRAIGIASDGSNFVYVSGSFKGEAQFGNTKITSAGDRDAFLARYRTDGKLDWVRAMGGPGPDDGFHVATDGKGTVCVTGGFVNTADFEGVSITSNGGTDIFVACFSSQGALKWVREGGSSGGLVGSWTEYGIGVAIAGDGSVYVSGAFQQTADFDGLSVTSRGADDGFIAKYDPNGSIIWVKRVGGGGSDDGNGIAVDLNGDAILTGFFSGQADFGPYVLHSRGAWDIYVSKWNRDGTVVWAMRAGGIWNDRGGQVTTDPHGNVYVTGYFKRTADFGSQTLTATGERDAYILKMGPDGTFDWTVPILGQGTTYGAGVDFGSNDRIYATGGFAGTGTFGTFSAVSRGDRDVYVTELDPLGNFQWVRTSGSGSRDIGYGIALNGPRVLVAGEVGGDPTFDSITLTCRGSDDAFLASIDLRPQPPTLISPEQDAAYLSTSPNLVWSSVDLATRYDVQIASDGAFSSLIYTENTPTTQVTFTAPVAEHEYYWRVHGVGLVGPGEWSEVGYFTVGSDGPLAPQLTSPTDNNSGISTSPTLTWLAAPEAGWHRIQVATSQAFVAPEINIDHVMGTSYQAMDLLPETRYFWRVAGVAEDGRMTFSAPWSFVTMMAPPGEVVLQTPSSGSEEVPAYATFTWATQEDADSYHLQVADNAAFEAPVINDSTLTTSQLTVFSPLEYATQYFWRVRAHNVAGFGPWCPAASFVIAVGTAVEDPGEIPTEYYLAEPYPNPFNPSTRIEFGVPETAHVNVAVFDVRGRLTAVLANGLAPAGRHVATWNAGSSGSGVYFVRMHTSQHVLARTLVVTK